jgi:glucuronosyltransferase
VRLFMTHGGLLSTQEAAVRGIPIVGIPIYANQHYNLTKILSSGIGINWTLQISQPKLCCGQ